MGLKDYLNLASKTDLDAVMAEVKALRRIETDKEDEIRNAYFHKDPLFYMQNKLPNKELKALNEALEALQNERNRRWHVRTFDRHGVPFDPELRSFLTIGN
jgi:hypothetical protein